jgi:hypothetical protein
VLRKAVNAASSSRRTVESATRFAGFGDVTAVADGAAVAVAADPDSAAPGAGAGFAVDVQPRHARPRHAVDTAASVRLLSRAETRTLLIIESPQTDIAVIRRRRSWRAGRLTARGALPTLKN